MGSLVPSASAQGAHGVLHTAACLTERASGQGRIEIFKPLQESARRVHCKKDREPTSVR